MNILKTKGIARSGILTISVPKELEDIELDITVRSTENVNLNNETELLKHEEKVKRMMDIAGSAKFPDFPITKYDVYDQ